MKRNILFLAAVTLLTSCASNYVVTDHVGRHLDGTRTVLSSDTTTLAETPYGQWGYTALDRGQVFDFRNERDTMRYSYFQALPRDGWTITHDSLPRMLRPQVTINKHFRWFTTRYRYTAVFPALDSLPVPVSQYLSSDEQRLLFQPLDLPTDWNGADMYALLDNLNTKYIKWWRHCFFEKEYEACYNYLSDSTQRALLTQYHDTLLALVLGDLPEYQTLSAKAKLIPELDFLGNMYTENESELDIMEFNYDFDIRVLWRVELPGGRTAEHMVSTERLITGDYVIEEYSDTVNWWAIALTLLLLVGGGFLVSRKL